MKGLFGTVPDAVPFGQFQREWNKMAETCGAQMCRGISSKRKAHLRERWKEVAWRTNWPLILKKIPEIPFCCGRTGWRIDFGFVIRNDDNHIKILEWWDREQTDTKASVEDEQRRADAAEAQKIKL